MGHMPRFLEGHDVRTVVGEDPLKEPFANQRSEVSLPAASVPRAQAFAVQRHEGKGVGQEGGVVDAGRWGGGGQGPKELQGLCADECAA